MQRCDEEFQENLGKMWGKFCDNFLEPPIRRDRFDTLMWRSYYMQSHIDGLLGECNFHKDTIFSTTLANVIGAI